MVLDTYYLQTDFHKSIETVGDISVLHLIYYSGHSGMEKRTTSNIRKASSGSASALQSCQSIGLSESLIHRGSIA